MPSALGSSSTRSTILGSLTLNMEALRSFKTSVTVYQSAPEFITGEGERD